MTARMWGAPMEKRDEPCCAQLVVFWYEKGSRTIGLNVFLCVSVQVLASECRRIDTGHGTLSALRLLVWPNSRE